MDRDLGILAENIALIKVSSSDYYGFVSIGVMEYHISSLLVSLRFESRSTTRPGVNSGTVTAGDVDDSAEYPAAKFRAAASNRRGEANE